jgi:hypothetical protein
VVGFLEQPSEVIDEPPPSPTVMSVASINISTQPPQAVEHRLREIGIDLSDADVSESERGRLAAFLIANRDIFATSLDEMGVTHLAEMTIETGSHPPIKQRPYRVSPNMKDEIDKQVDKMLNNGIIRPSSSPYSSPVVMVKKKNGEYRFAVDYRKLNAITTTMNYPLPRLEDVTDILNGAQVFSVMDLFSGFWQVPMAERDKEKTAFICHSGLYEFERVPFGLKNSPTVFQRVMETALRGLNYKTALCYVDDIISFSTSFSAHLENLTDIFQHLRAAGLRLKPSKCQFCVKQVTYLGHILSKHGVSADPDKVRLVQEFPRPRNQKDVRSFLGLASYYRKFVKGFASIASPLTQLLSKDLPFEWTTDCQTAFDALKAALTTAPVLAFPDFRKQFVLYTDASATAIGYILGQRGDDNKEHVISYGGRSLRASEKNWSISEREALAVVEGIKHYKVYLANNKFLVKTDHSAAQHLQQTKDTTGRLGRWAILLQAYDFVVEYKPGKAHSNADSLSRRPYEPTPETDADEADVIPDVFCVHQDSGLPSFPPPAYAAHDWSKERSYFVNVLDIPTLKTLQRRDPQLKIMIDYLQDGTLLDDDKKSRQLILEAQDHVLDEGILYHLWYPRGSGTKDERVIRQLVVPFDMRNDVLLSFHDSLLGGAHQGVDRTYQSIRLRYYWPHMYNDITQYVRSCLDCQQSKRPTHVQRPPLCPLPVPGLFERMHMDFLGPLETSPEGYKYILLVVDSYSKWPEAFPLKTTDAVEVAWVLYREIFSRYGAPDALLSDRGQNFMSKLITELCRLFQVTRLRTSSYHAQTNAQCERFNSFIGSALR